MHKIHSIENKSQFALNVFFCSYNNLKRKKKLSLFNLNFIFCTQDGVDGHKTNRFSEPKLEPNQRIHYSQSY